MSPEPKPVKKKNSNRISASRDKRKSGNGSNERLSKAADLLFLFLLLIALFLVISLITFNPEEAPGSDKLGRTSGWLGQLGAAVAYGVSIFTLGRFGSLCLPAIIFIILIWWVTGKKFAILRWIIGLFAAGFFTGFGIAFVNLWIQPDEVYLILYGSGPFRLAQLSLQYLQKLGTIFISTTIILSLAVVLFNLKLTRLIGGTLSAAHKSFVWGARMVSGKVEPAPEEKLSDDDQPVVDSEVESEVEPDIDREEGVEVDPTSEDDISLPFVPDDGAVSVSTGPRELPPLKLLDVPPDDRQEVDLTELDENARRLEEKLASMRISAKVIKTNPGPIITRYDLEPAADVKIARIVSLSDDIAMALKARGVRILAPIPGEAAVGIEIPNQHSQIVYIREIIGSEEFRKAEAPLTIALGKDTNGGIFCVDLAKAPHLLIAGATGSGKSVCINTIITSILYRSDPRDVRLVLIDPKKIELSLYARLEDQHLVFPPGLGEKVITKPENAVKTLQSIHAEMDRRYTILAEAGVRSLGEYNRWIEKSAPEDETEIDQREHLPYLVVIIDELADLMMTVRREFEELVVRLAQMARAVGIHLVVATQRPSVDVVTGLIKANFPARIAFKVATKYDSRTIIDTIGAEALLGRGDMLVFGLAGAKLERFHGALVTTEEIEKVIEFVRSQPACDSSFRLPDPEIQKLVAGMAEVDSAGRTSTDELFEEAAKIVVRTEQGSVSVLQRRLRVGYARAARLIDELEQVGIVGPFDGSKARQVIVTPEELSERYGIQV